MLNELKSLLVLLLACLIMGWLLQQMHIPAPYLLGSLLGAWLLTKLKLAYIPKLAVPRWFHITIILGVSTLIGATFSPDILDKLSLWMLTVVAMLVTTLVATWAGYVYLTKRRGYDPTLALLCTLPGGQAEVIALSRDLVEKDYIVVFCHLVRVAVVMCLIPLLLAVTQGSSGVAASYVATAQLPSVFDVSWLILGQFSGLALGGYMVAKLCHLPIPHLLGPLLLSSTVHMLGWLHIPRMYEFIILAQVTIGGAIGVKLASVDSKELFSYLKDALANTLIVVSIYCLVALLLAHWSDVSTMKMVLAFIPGGIYEVTVLALLFGFDIAFVAFHHTVRVLLIFLALPFVAAFLRRNKANNV